MADEPIAAVVARVLALHEKATPGPWESLTTWPGTEDRLEDDLGLPYSVVGAGDFPEQNICEVWGGEHDDGANAEWIASTRTDAVTLAREVARLRNGIEAHERLAIENRGHAGNNDDAEMWDSWACSLRALTAPHEAG